MEAEGRRQDNLTRERERQERLREEEQEKRLKGQYLLEQEKVKLAGIKEKKLEKAEQEKEKYLLR